MSDTIVAIATANGVGSISIVRLSGSDALAIAQKIIKKDSLSVRYAHLCSLYSSDSNLIDKSIVIYFKAPYSFSGEDIVEFQCHGGHIVAQQVLEATLYFGARLARAGEFSQRAFLNNKMDLTEIEAMAALIEAKSADAASVLAKQLRGDLRHYIESIRDELITIIAHCEVLIDYAEEDLPPELYDSIIAKLNELAKKLESTLESSKRRSAMLQGFRVAIVGKPNVGKSSLLNALLDYERAIVSDIAGTTRDTIEEQVRIGTHIIRLVDTAGIRESSDIIERIGIERSIESIDSSDIVVALFDGSREIDSEDSAIIELLKNSTKDKSVLVFINKSDLELKIDISQIAEFNPIKISTKSSIDVVSHALEAIMDVENDSDEMMLISLRQIESTKAALLNIKESLIPLEDGELELFTYHINEALKSISSISRVYEIDEMFDKMFGDFCLGK